MKFDFASVEMLSANQIARFINQPYLKSKRVNHGIDWKFDYQRVRTDGFSQNSPYLINEWSLNSVDDRQIFNTSLLESNEQIVKLDEQLQTALNVVEYKKVKMCLEQVKHFLD